MDEYRLPVRVRRVILSLAAKPSTVRALSFEQHMTHKAINEVLKTLEEWSLARISKWVRKPNRGSFEAVWSLGQEVSEPKP